MQFLQNVASAAKVSIEDIRQLNLGTAEVSFLFGKDLTAYIDEIRKHGIALFAANAQYRDMNASLPTPPNYDHLATINSMHDELLWMHNQYDEATLKFGKYLRLS